MLRRVSAWPTVTYDWRNGFTDPPNSETGTQYVAFDVAAQVNSSEGFGFESVAAVNDKDQNLFREFNAFLASVLPPDPKQEDYPDFNEFIRARRWSCSELPNWTTLARSPEFNRLQQAVAHSASFQENFWLQGCFLGKRDSAFSHDFVLYKNALWALEKDLCMTECIAIMEGILRREEQRVEFLKRGVSGQEDSFRRDRIPEQVRHEVWRRDEGKCARCGSRSSLEFDHIVPVAMGGSNTARNIELLCQDCNRSKGASV